jgi:hypothetical protein
MIHVLLEFQIGGGERVVVILWVFFHFLLDYKNVETDSGLRFPEAKIHV